MLVIAAASCSTIFKAQYSTPLRQVSCNGEICPSGITVLGDKNVFEDSLMRITWVVDNSDFPFLLENKTQSSIIVFLVRCEIYKSGGKNFSNSL